ncbi:hypothetical protein ACWFQ8_29860 [Streptomyces sp. NPDC055254]
MSAVARAGVRMRAGSARVCRERAEQLRTWAARGRREDLDGWKAALGSWLRLALLAAAGYGAYWSCRRWPWLMWVLAVWWVAAAWRAGRPGWKPTAPDPAAAAQGPDPTAEPGPISLAKEHPPGPSLGDVLTAARALGTPHVHLAAIEEYLGVPRGTVRPVLTTAGIPITDVRMQGRGTSTGIRGADVPPLSSPSPIGVADVVGAGHGANNSNNNALRVKEEAGMTIILDPSERRAYTV